MKFDQQSFRRGVNDLFTLRPLFQAVVRCWDSPLFPAIFGVWLYVILFVMVAVTKLLGLELD